jgi:hypothetical protein
VCPGGEGEGREHDNGRGAGAPGVEEGHSDVMERLRLSRSWTIGQQRDGKKRKEVVCCGVDQAGELVEIGRRITSTRAKTRTRAVGLNGIRGPSNAEI